MTIKEQTKKLWRETFPDTEEFVDFYFEKVYSDEINYVIEENNRVIAALQAIPFDFKTDDKILKTAYLSGICTDKEYQKQGFMRKLLEKTHNILKLKGFDATFLIPAEKYLFDIYQKFGYETFFYKATKFHLIENIDNHKFTIEILNKNEKDIVFEYYQKRQQELDCAVLCSKNYFETIFDYFILDKKKIVIAKDRGKMVGIAFVSGQGKILQSFCDNSEIKTEIVNFIAQLFNLQEVTEKIFVKSNIPYGMLHFLNKSEISTEYYTPQMPIMMDE